MAIIRNDNFDIVTPKPTRNSERVGPGEDFIDLAAIKVRWSYMRSIDQHGIEWELASDLVTWTKIGRFKDAAYNSKYYLRYNEDWVEINKNIIGLNNVKNIDTTNASNITAGKLPSSVISCNSYYRYPCC